MSGELQISLPPLHGVSDPHVRRFLESLTVVLGDFASSNGVVTKSEFSSLANQAIADALAGAGAGGLPQPGAVSNAIDALAQDIQSSILYDLLNSKLSPVAIDDLRNRLDAAMRSAASGISTEAETRESKDYALASAVNRIWGVIGGSTAVIEDGALAGATPTSAVATKWNQVQAAVTDPNTGNVADAAILEETRAYANSADSTLNAIYSVRAQVSSGGQTVVGGFALAATSGAGSAAGPTIDFGVLANRFWIAAPSSGYDPAADYSVTSNGVPFVVLTTSTTINGKVYPPGVYLKKAFIGQAAIDSATIADAAIISAKIADAAITTAKIQDASITTAKIGTAQVDTLQLAGQAVTFPMSAFTAGDGGVIDEGDSWSTIQSLTGTFTGAPVMVMGSFLPQSPAPIGDASYESGYLEVRLMRGTTELVWFEGIGGAPLTMPLYIDSPPAGSSTYKLQAKLFSNVPQQRALATIEMKR